jgi:hypothetical protein
VGVSSPKPGDGMTGKQKLANEPFKEPAVYIVMFLLCAIFVIDAVVLTYAR